jgi:three-Cys-motif partner protein
VVFVTPLEFVGEAISLSGLTGTKLKCDVVGRYYPFWWKITSGGKSLNYQKPTAIVELYAATGEDYIKETGETVLGSSGHALELKVNHLNDPDVDTTNLKVVLIEENPDCFILLKKVIKRRWDGVSVDEAEGALESNSTNIYLLNQNLGEAIATIENIELGNAIYYFDPLRSVEWKTIEDVASKRIKNFCQTGTEFMIFLFTSDWFIGRDELAPLPKTSEETQWSSTEKATVTEADALFGNKEWRRFILNAYPIQTRQKIFVGLYKTRLYKWFRYVLPMPFAPKENELFHLILCSNYEAGVKVTKDFYDSVTGNPVYLPGRLPSTQAYSLFKKAHPEITKGLKGNRRPLEWRILWKTIKYHEGGVCDYLCRDFADIEPDALKVISAIQWLHRNNYLELLEIENAWNYPIDRYKLNWNTIKEELNVDLPPELKPISPEEFGKLQWRKLLDALELHKGRN